MKEYSGNCHCGEVKYKFFSEELVDPRLAEVIADEAGAEVISNGKSILLTMFFLNVSLKKPLLSMNILDFISLRPLIFVFISFRIFVKLPIIRRYL